MASPKRKLRVILSPRAVDELHEIWQWNAERYSLPHADAYIRYLKKCIDDLSTVYGRGMTVSIRPDLRYVLIRRKGSGHGHIVVYRCDEKVVNVLHVFHTAQDWQAKITETN